MSGEKELGYDSGREKERKKKKTLETFSGESVNSVNKPAAVATQKSSIKIPPMAPPTDHAPHLKGPVGGHDAEVVAGNGEGLGDPQCQPGPLLQQSVNPVHGEWRIA